MNADLKNLIELEKVDREITRLTDEVSALPKRIAEIEHKLSDVKAQVDQAKNAMRAQDSKRRQYESEIQSLQSKISKFRDQSLDVNNRNDTFAIRTMFWWGHFLSVTLHLKGQYKTQYLQPLLKNLPLLAERGFYICVGEDEWRHEFEEDNYKPLSQLNSTAVAKMLPANNFCKLSAKISLPQWNQSKELLVGLYETIFTSIDD